MWLLLSCTDLGREFLVRLLEVCLQLAVHQILLLNAALQVRGVCFKVLDGS